MKRSTSILLFDDTKPITRAGARVVRPCAAALLTATLASCSIDLAPPESLQLRCTSDRECPVPLQCSTGIGRCIRPGQDTEPPGVVAGSPRLSRAAVSRGVELTATFAVTKALAQEPRVYFGSPGREAFASSSSSTPTPTASWSGAAEAASSAPSAT